MRIRGIEDSKLREIEDSRNRKIDASVDGEYDAVDVEDGDILSDRDDEPPLGDSFPVVSVDGYPTRPRCVVDGFGDACLTPYERLRVGFSPCAFAVIEMLDDQRTHDKECEEGEYREGDELPCDAKTYPRHNGGGYGSDGEACHSKTPP